MKQPDEASEQQEFSIQQGQFYIGPIPAPETLEKFEEIQPGFTDRLLKRLEKEQQERITTQNKLIDAEIKLQLKELSNFKRGQIFALVAVFLVVGLCVYAFYLGNGTAARDIAVAVIVGLAGVFIAGRVYVKGKKT